MTANDLQPKDTKIKIHDKDYTCKPIRMSHRLIIAKLQPFFKQFELLSQGKEVDLPATKILEFEEELDVLIKSLIPELNNLTLRMEDIIEIITQIMQNAMPDESKELKEAKVEVNSDLKAKVAG